MVKTVKTVAKAKRSGGYLAQKPRREVAGAKLSKPKDKPRPPMPNAGRGSTVLESKSGRYIIASPAKSANTVTSWSNAFKAN
jgi:hypothetical protein